jgi:predicted house-cleaning noncanonical NTP pyrophosphatase (MazG superfamily)
MRYNKLVRDNIHQIIRDEGKEPITHIANDEESFTRLKDKLQEEVDEYLQSHDAEELADILEVIHCLARHKGVSL